MYHLDANHAEIVDAFKRCGCRVAEIARGKSEVAGLPDLVVGVPDHRRGQCTVILVEVKTADGRLSPAQVDFIAEWAGYPVYVARSVDDVVDIYNYFNREREQ